MGELDLSVELVLSNRISFETHWIFQTSSKVLGHVGHVDTIVGTLGTSQGRNHSGEIEFEHRRVGWRGSALLAEHALRTGVCLHPGNTFSVAVCLTEIADGYFVRGKETHRGTIFRSHVGQRGTIGQRDMRGTRTEELDKLANHAVFAQGLGDGEHKIRRGATGGQFAHQTEAYHLRQHHADGLSQKSGLCFDTTNTPTDNTETIDHGGVRVGTDHTVRIEKTILVEDRVRQILEVHLMNDTTAGWDDAQVIEGVRTPLEELEALSVALHLLFLVARQGVLSATHIHLHRVVDHNVGGTERIDLGGISTQTFHGFTHGSKIDHSRSACKILHENARRQKRDVGMPLGGGEGENGLEMRRLEVHSVLVAQHILE
mmetsp:Transcript_2208/g.5228  ORF Transcript_2208/g.5228 Transcript_2208/m.5228 type:complete len:373 (-) Transcript_2208:195-1313(-)